MRKSQRKRRTRARQKWRAAHPPKLTSVQRKAYDLALATMILGRDLMDLFGEPEVEWLPGGAMRITDKRGHFVAGSHIRLRVMGENGQWYPPEE